MSFLIRILKRICCVEDEEREINRHQNQSYHDFLRAPNINSFSGSYSPLAQTTSSRNNKVYYENKSWSTVNEYLVASKLHEKEAGKSVTSSAVTGINNKNPRVASEPTSPSFVHYAANQRSLTIKPIETLKNPGEISQKPSSLSSSTGNTGKILKNPGEIPQKPSSLSSSTGNTGKILKNPGEISQKPSNLSSSTGNTGKILKNPEEISQKPTGLSFSFGNIPQSSNRGANMPTKQKSFYDICSASDEILHSSTKLPPLHSSKPSPSESAVEKLHSFLKTDSPSSSPLFADACSPKCPPLSTKPVLSLASPSSMSPKNKTNYIWVEKGASSTYVFPKDVRTLIEKDIVPGVLKMPLCMSTYREYFHALLYAEDCHLEKWEGFEMKNVNLELHEASIYKTKRKLKNLNEAEQKDEKTFVAFEMDKIPERRPFLLSRDFVFVHPSCTKIEPFQGVIYRVVKSNLVLAEFGESFYAQHNPECKYDVKFSFNRVCLKRAHQAIADASSPLLRNLLFPDSEPQHELPYAQHVNNNYRKATLAVNQILRLQGAPPFLVEGPLCIAERDRLSSTGMVVVEAILKIFRSDPSKRILLCAPTNRTCDLLMRGLKKEMSDSDMFRANAAFRELDGIPADILPSCLYQEEAECFSCPSLEELGKFKVILSTFMSCFRLHSEGIKGGHFSHIFLVDGSSATEPETVVPLTNFANDRTIVVVTGAPRNRSGWVRSKIARQNGLMISYFERLRESGRYKKLDPRVITQLEDNSNERCSSKPAFWDI